MRIVRTARTRKTAVSEDSAVFSSLTLFLPEVNCTLDEFQCSNGDCIQKRWVCDGMADCADKSDEMRCGDSSVAVSCNPTTELRCASGQCLDIKWRCDGERDCPDGTDEMVRGRPQITFIS